jgi:apolipoprotein N-acyltransferase
LAVAFAAGLVAGFCQPPYSLGLLIVVPLVALLWTWHHARPAHAALYGFAFGLASCAVVLQWISYFGFLAYVALLATMAAYIALAGLVTALLARRGIASPLLTAAVWVVAEALRGRFPFGGMPWADIGVALHDVSAARALASVGGVLLVSYVTVAAAGFVLDAGLALRSHHTRSAVLAGVGIVAVVGVGLVAVATRFEPRPTGELRVAVLQGDDQELSLAGQRAQQLTGNHLALAAGLEGNYDLIVFPESALDTNPEQDPQLRSILAQLAAKHDAAVLVNARVPVSPSEGESPESVRGEVYNADLLYDPDGTLQGKYAKQHLVPFGEYVPLRGLLGDIDALRTNVPYDFTAGDDSVVFDVKGTPVGNVICFESAFGPLVREQVRDGAEAIVVSTNNRSYRRSGNSEQHLALGQLRAAETGRPVVQASVSGISGIIDADGTVHDRTELFEQAVVDATITTTTGETLYVRFGDWLVWTCSLAVLIAAAVAVFRPRTRSEPPTLDSVTPA